MLAFNVTYEGSGHRSNALLSAASVNTAGSYSPDGGYLSLTCKVQVNCTSLPIEWQPRKQNASVSSRCQALEKLGGRAPPTVQEEGVAVCYANAGVI